MVDPTYKIACTPLNIVVLAKVLEKKEQEALWEKLAYSLDKKSKPFTTYGYKETLVREFIIDFDAIMKNYDEEEEETAVNFIYERLVEYFPPFKLEVLCFNVNLLNLKKVQDKAVEAASSYDPPTNPLDALIEEQMDEGANNLVSWGTKEGITKIEKYLKSKIVGQDSAVESVVRVLKLHASELVSHSSLFFVGPTGVGKSELSKLLGKRYSGNFLKIDCEAYSDKHDKASLLGSPPGYIGSQDKSILADKAAKSNAWVILFDEIEKANDKLKDTLLNLMDEGTIQDASGKTLDFSKSIFIFTSNQGMGEIKHGRNIGFSKDEENTYSMQTDKVKESIERDFKPEFLNRIDDIVYFNELTEEDSKKVANIQLKEYPVKRSQELVDYVVKGGFSKKYGARNLKRFIKNTIGIKVAETIIDRKIPLSGKLYEVQVIEGNLVVSNLVDFDIKTEEKAA